MDIEIPYRISGETAFHGSINTHTGWKTNMRRTCSGLNSNKNHLVRNTIQKGSKDQFGQRRQLATQTYIMLNHFLENSKATNKNLSKDSQGRPPYGGYEISSSSLTK